MSEQRSVRRGRLGLPELYQAVLGVPFLVQIPKHLPQLGLEPSVASEDLIRKVLSVILVVVIKDIIYSRLELSEGLALEA